MSVKHILALVGIVAATLVGNWYALRDFSAAVVVTAIVFITVGAFPAHKQPAKLIPRSVWLLRLQASEATKAMRRLCWAVLLHGGIVLTGR